MICTQPHSKDHSAESIFHRSNVSPRALRMTLSVCLEGIALIQLREGQYSLKGRLLSPLSAMSLGMIELGLRIAAAALFLLYETLAAPVRLVRGIGGICYYSVLSLFKKSTHIDRKIGESCEMTLKGVYQLPLSVCRTAQFLTLTIATLAYLAILHPILCLPLTTQAERETAKRFYALTQSVAHQPSE